MERHTGAKTFALMAAAWSMPVSAQTLVNIATADNGDELFVDRMSLQTRPPLGEFRRFAATRIWAINQVKATRRTPARTERFLFSFDCAARRSLILVYRNSRTGTKMQDWESADLDFKYATPPVGSLAEFSMYFACSGGKMPVSPATNQPGSEEAEEADAVSP
jgi:hypothetical protein